METLFLIHIINSVKILCIFLTVGLLVGLFIYLACQEEDAIVHSKRELFDAIMQNRKNIYAVYPKKKAKAVDR